MPQNDYRKSWDTSSSGWKSDAKVIKVHLYPDEGEDKLYVLSARQGAALLKISQYLEWVNRFDVLPTDIMDSDAFQAWNDQLKQRLMTPMEICAEIINCLENDEDTQNAFKNFISNYNNLNGTDNVVRSRTDTENAANLAGNTNPSCDLDILWAQCKYVVQTTNSVIVDLLEKFETLTNPIELTQAAIEIIPAAGNTLATPIKYTALIQNFIAENYSADYTTTPITGYEDVLACELFCACRSDCKITIDRFFDILLNRVIDRFSTGIPVISQLIELANFMVGIDTGGEFIADMAFLLVWGGLKLANFVIGGLLKRPQIGDYVIRIWLELAANNPDSDWEIICTECAETWEEVLDLTLTDGGFVAVNSIALWADGIGWGVNTPINTNTVVMQLELPLGTYTYIGVEATEAPAYISEVTLRSDAFPDGSNIDQQSNAPGTAFTELDGLWVDPEYLMVNYSKTISTTFSGYTGVITTITLRGNGVNPFTF